jgi:hypothetical protein
MFINFARKIYSHDAISIVEYGARVYGKSFCTDFKNELADRFRSPHLWAKSQNGEWQLRHNVWEGGLYD